MSYKRSRAAFESDTIAPPQHAPFVLYGTPLPVYDPEARDDGSYVPLWKQEVTDERGRKRLHGAFTGGFSAGYFNTVGSKEGWTPSTFVSSRANRATARKDGKQQRAEDFMDEEDLAEQAESQNLVTQNAFAGLGRGESIGGTKGMFSDLFKSTDETKGTKLLQRMGWRQGQGVGPKVRRRAQGDKSGETHFFAPDNPRMIAFVKKTDRKGLGHAGEARLASGASDVKDEGADSGDDARILRTSRSQVVIKTKPSRKSGFGVGVLNDNGSDDEDPYSMGPRISYTKIIGADKKKRKGGLVVNSASSTVVKPATAKRLAQRASNAAVVAKCRDGRLPLDGFVLASAAFTTFDTDRYLLPEIPLGWKPSKQAISTKPAPQNYKSTADAANASALDVNSRAALLGEQQLPGKSVFDYIKPEARNRLASASGNANLPQALGESAPAGFEQDEADKRRTLWDLVPRLDEQTAAAALHRGTTGWMPYAEDESKRARYRYYLELQVGKQSKLPEKPKSFSLDEWSKEMREFAEAAEIFKPMSGLMASRFTSSTSEGPKLASDAPDSAPRVATKEEDPAEKAARMGMYGLITRSRHPFYPTRLLCKRFNVKPPPNVGAGGTADVDGRVVDESRGREVVSQASLERLSIEASLKLPSVVPGDAQAMSQGNAASPRTEPLKVDSEHNDAIEGKRAGEEVFKAIFGSDDDDD